MAYGFDQVFAADPANPSNVAQNASIKIFAPGDATQTPIAITDTSGSPLPNPVPVNANGFGPAFIAQIDRVGWAGGGFTGFFTSYEGLKEEAVAARAAAETAAAGAAAAAQADIATRAAAGEFKGDRGLDGSNVLPTSEAIAQAVTTDGPAKAALSATIDDKVTAALGSNAASPFFQKVDLLTFGHSFVAGTPEITAPEHYYRTLLAEQLGMTHPTAADNTNLQFAVGGLKAEQLAQRIMGSAPYPNPRRGVALMQLFMNTARVRGADATTLKGARQALRTMIAVVSAESRIEPSDTTVWTAESGTWTTSASANYSGGSFKQTTVQNSYVDIVLPAKAGSGAYHLMTLGRTGAGPVIEVRNVTLGTVITNVDTSNQVFAGDSPTAVNYALPINAAAGQTIRITKTDATANPLVLDTLLVPAANPNPIIGMKEPYLADYSLSTSFPNGSDAALDTFNALWDEMAAQYNNVIVADPNKGYWNKFTDIGADGVHPNEQGNAHLAACARDALLGYALQKSIALVTTGKVPVIDNNVTPITTYASDEFARADSATVGSTEIGSYAWTANPVGDQAKWTIASQQLVKSGAALTGAKEILVDTTRADGKVGVTFVSAVTSGCGLTFRVAADGNSGYLVHTLTDGSYLLRRRSGTTYTTLYTSSVGIAAAGDRVEVLMAGSSLSLIVNGTTLGTVTSSTNATATRHGMWANSSSSPTYDTFKHTSA